MFGISFAKDNFDLTNYKNTGDTGSVGNTITKPVKEIAGIAVAIIRIVGSGVAIIMIITVAIKYMSAAPGERADLKKSSVQYVIGAIIVFGSTNILGILMDFANDNINK